MTADSSARNVFRKNGVASLGSTHGRNLITTANPSGGSSASLLQKQLSFKTPVGSKQIGKSDEIEIVDSSNIENFNAGYNKNSIIGWICCAPCIWFRTSAAVHKMAITSATLLVTTLLVASPILFLISTAPSPLPRDCYMEGDRCSSPISSPPECMDVICESVASSIQARLNWNKDPCTEFKKFSCWRNSRNKNITNLIEMGNSQKSVDTQMLSFFQNKAMDERFKILHHLYESCLQQTTNSTEMHRIFDSLGGYLPVGSTGPSSIAPLIAKIYELGPSPLVDLYYDLSYGRRPHILLIISGPSTSSTILEAELIFKSLKAHLKRAPSLKGAALVKLSALKIQSQTWEGFSNVTDLVKSLESLNINAECWFQNILEIYKKNKLVPNEINMREGSHEAWAYPIVSTTFYDTLSHSIVVPLSVILIPYFNAALPPYLHYASVGVSIAKEILRSITKSFDEKAMRCVPHSVNIFSNYSRMDILIHSGGMQISYHSMLSLTGPIKGMARLPGLSLTPTQIFFLVSGQELCAESNYLGIDISAPEFDNILGWLVAQGGSATEVFKCPSGSMINIQKTCNVL
ncbi:GL21940 [Drosophila persimilis]|uniref:GL21940 n=1 Tax=Drosophila persimilis TaxID=7234 RepID=B4GE24_DROPE|nr:GL21940 [Drosophila persimilis]